MFILPYYDVQVNYLLAIAYFEAMV